MVVLLLVIVIVLIQSRQINWVRKTQRRNRQLDWYIIPAGVLRVWSRAIYFSTDFSSPVKSNYLVAAVLSFPLVLRLPFRPFPELILRREILALFFSTRCCHILCCTTGHQSSKAAQCLGSTAAVFGITVHLASWIE